jgi:CheY-like chemotaxis protein
MENVQERCNRILVAEDVDVVAYSIARGLEGRGFQTAVAHDGEECLAMARSFAPDLILLDVMMPKGHGMEALKQLKAQEDTQRIGVIVCTAEGFKPALDLALELGAFDVIVKPIDDGALVARVDRFFTHTEPAAVPPPAPAVRPQSIPGVEVFRPVLDTTGVCCRFWGTRGSIPISGPPYLRHGGNTSCLEVEYGGARVIFDAGSGIRDLGLALAAGPPCKLNLFITHTHWDHIQGFPFFAPAFIPGFEITIYGAKGFGKSLEAIFHGQLDRDYFPVQMEDMRAQLVFKDLGDEPVGIGPMQVTSAFMQHPGATLGYKLEVHGKTISFIPDNEFLKGYTGSPHRVGRGHSLLTDYLPILEFLKGVDVLIHEAQYMPEEYGGKIGWGHSSLGNACLLAALTEAKRWVVIHHDPMHTDDFLERKLNLTRQVLRGLQHPIEVEHGFDRMTEYF